MPSPTPSPPDRIVCVDCLGTCHLITFPPEDGFESGDALAYRCEDCGDRWDIVWESDEDD